MKVGMMEMIENLGGLESNGEELALSFLGKQVLSLNTTLAPES